MANVYNEYPFGKIWQVNDLQQLLNTPPDPVVATFTFLVVTFVYVEKHLLLLSLSKNKVVGLDKLPGRLLLAVASVISHSLSFILNLSLVWKIHQWMKICQSTSTFQV